MIEDPVDPSKTQFAIYKAGEIRLIDEVESRQRILRPIPRNSEIVRHIRLPRRRKEKTQPPKIVEQFSPSQLIE